MLGPDRADQFVQGGPRRTPRKSLIVVIPDNHVVSPDLVNGRLPMDLGGDELDIIVACAGKASSLAAIRGSVRDIRVLLAPAGTSSEELRELAMNRATGDVVTLVSGTPAR